LFRSGDPASRFLLANGAGAAFASVPGLHQAESMRSPHQGQWRAPQNKTANSYAIEIAV
jgi:hypothetical protein